jgi:hypothetical protein
MNLTSPQGQIDTFKDGLIPHRGMEIADLK